MVTAGVTIGSDAQRVVYLSCSQLTAKMARDWYIDHLRESGIQIEYWDLTHLLRGEVVEHFELQQDYVRSFADWRQVEQAVKACQDAVFILAMPKIWQFKNAFRVLTRYRCKTVMIKWGAVPAVHLGSRVLQSLFSPGLLLKKIKNRLHAFLFRQSWYLRPYDLVFAAGQVMLSRPEGALKTVPIALFDYDQYSQRSDHGRLVEGKYAVFLDTFMPYHPDLALVAKKRLDPDVYYAELHRFFSALEKKLGIEVVIAAHPRARYSRDEFRGRKLIAGKTPELVRHAELVLCHASTSVSYVVLNRKPLWTIYSEEMAQIYQDSYMQHIGALSSYLQAPSFNISQDSWPEMPARGEFLEARYAAYQDDFLATAGIAGGQSKEIFLREILLLGQASA